ncbi:exodeoxyribonuclease V subunit alpha [Neisseria sp.]|uniref:exodeoxyribonuclease V subunit alpha n=1 Tax=Neisseria sp. TaxID=192066 RepID=UPI00289D5FD4|nr:exodeoxyribonuclease V subunit alpha [Neisseria sp.]
MMDIDIDQAATEAVASLLERTSPHGAEIVRPFLMRLFQALSEGHTFIRLTAAECQSLLRATPIVGTQGGTPLQLVQDKLFLGRIWQLERDLAREICRLASAEVAAVDWLTVSSRLNEWFVGEGSSGQKTAAALAMLQPFMLISGGPGTGKTTTVAKLLALLCENIVEMPRIALAAPTGKAAAHMSRALQQALGNFTVNEATKQHLHHLEGQTVHRLLKLRPPMMRPLFDQGNPLPLDILLIDEASMLDTALMLDILRAVPTGCRVILLGDENQLPSVGAGAVLAELVQPTVLTSQQAEELDYLLPGHGLKVAEAVQPLAANCYRLTYSHRFGENSGIGCLARSIVAGEAQEAWQAFDRFPQELLLRQETQAQLAERFYALQQNYWQAVTAQDLQAVFRHQADVVVLTARREDAEAFNRAYRRQLQHAGLAGEQALWFAGQTIMVIRNDYELGVFNGDIGVVMPDGEEEGGQTKLAAYFPDAGGWRRLPLSRLPEHETAFAMTVHKSQGSEYRKVWLLPPTDVQQSHHLLNRSLLYTAVTRAREQFAFCGSRIALESAVRSNESRRTALRERIAEETANRRLG